MNWAPSHRVVGISTLLFAACPSIELGLMALSDFARASRGQGDHLPVGIGVPPIWIIGLIAFGLSLPWIVAGNLLLRHSPVGQWLGLALTIPTIPLVLLFGGGTIHGFYIWLVEHLQDGLLSVLVFGPFTLFGLQIVLMIWWFQIAYWRRLRESPPSVPQTPS